MAEPCQAQRNQHEVMRPLDQYALRVADSSSARVGPRGVVGPVPTGGAEKSIAAPRVYICNISNLGETITALALTAALAPMAVSASTSTPHFHAVKVFVTSAAAQNGFTDPSKDNADTVKDLRKAIDDQKSLALADSAEDAAIVLTVLGRETANLTGGLMGTAARDRTIRVKFVYQDFKTELTASAQGGTLGSGGAWGKAAKMIA
jgi:hypothetical protein